MTKYLTSAEAADQLRFSEQTLRIARSTGLLGGVEAPPFIKLGYRILYDPSDLQDWVNQFKKRRNTKE